MVAIVVVVLIVAIATSGEPGPATGAADIVPGDSLAYIHLSTDTSRPAVQRALNLAGKFPDYPLLTGGLIRRLSAIAGGSSSVDFGADIRPWLGKEAALALLNTPTSTAGSLIVLDVADHARAQSFLSQAGAAPDGTYDGAQLYSYRTGTELAFVRHYLVFGQDASVRASLDAATGRTHSLASSATYRNAADGEPDSRVLDAYASVAGVRRLLVPQGRLVGALGVLLYQPALTGATISLSAVSGGAQVRVHSALDPNLAPVNGRPLQFSPTLQQLVPSGSMLLLDVKGLDRVAPRVLNAGSVGGVAGRIGPLLQRLGGALAAEGADVHGLVSLFAGETAVAIAPAAGAAGSSTGAAPPSLLVLARTAHESSTRTSLAQAAGSLAQLFPPPSSGSGQTTSFNDRQVGDVTIHQLVLGPSLQVDYAVFRGLVAVATSFQALAAVVSHAAGLPHESAFKNTLANRPDPLTSLVFLDFSQLLRLGEQTGLTASARFRAIGPDLEKVRAIGLTSTSGKTDSTAELSVQIP